MEDSEKQRPEVIRSKAPGPPRILGGIGSPSRPKIRAPQITYSFPQNFDRASKDRVLAAWLNAEQLLEQQQSSIRYPDDAVVAMVKFIMRAFAAFAEQACNQVVQGLWSLQEADTECRRFIRSSAIAFNLTSDVSLTREGEIRPDVSARIEESKEWKTFRQRLREVGELQAHGTETDGRSLKHKFADDTFSVAHVRIIEQSNEKLQQVLRQVALTGSIGGFAPAITKWAVERNRDAILALADAYVEAYRLFGAPSDTHAEEEKLSMSAQQIAAGSIVNIRHQLELLEKRTGGALNDQTGYFNREIGASMKTAVKEGLLRLRRARWQEIREEPVDSGKSGSGRASSPKPELADRLTSQQGATTSTQMETKGGNHNQPERKPVRRNSKYEEIDEALIKIAKSRPSSHEEAFRALDGRCTWPNAKPFKSARGWFAGFRSDQTRARAWLSKAWSRLNLPPFPRGPK